MSRSSAAMDQQAPPHPWMMSRTAFERLQTKPASSFTDTEIDRLIDLHIQRNALGVYGSLVDRGAQASRETLGRAFGISKGRLREYGYLAANGSSATRKGIRKAIEKLHSDDAWDKYVEYEELLKSFRKGERRKPKGRSEFQRKLARQQLESFRGGKQQEQESSSQALAQKILAQMGPPFALSGHLPKKQVVRQQKPVARQQKPVAVRVQKQKSAARSVSSSKSLSPKDLAAILKRAR